MQLADLVVVISMGRIKQIGKPQDIRARPASAFVRSLSPPEPRRHAGCASRRRRCGLRIQQPFPLHGALAFDQRSR